MDIQPPLIAVSDALALEGIAGAMNERQLSFDVPPVR
jgi:hypothetical protein